MVSAGFRAQVWDLGGQTSIRPYWRCYYPNTQAIIYVVDSSDTERIGTSAEEFHAILDEEELKDALILVYANKQARRRPAPTLPHPRPVSLLRPLTCARVLAGPAGSAGRRGSRGGPGAVQHQEPRLGNI